MRHRPRLIPAAAPANARRSRRGPHFRPWPGVLVVLILGGMVSACGGAPRPPVADTAATGPATTGPAPVRAQKHMIAVANPLAAEAGRAILRRGGSAVDAAIAAQMVLGLVEPQSSGIGGGGFMLHHAAKTGALDAYDGRETAPATIKPDLFLKPGGERMAFFEAVVGGTSVGVPGLLRMLETAHAEHGKLPWADLFQPAIKLAEEGFKVSPRLARLIAGDGHLKTFDTARAYFYDATGAPRREGAVLVNTAYAETLRAIAEDGADAFYKGAIARDIVAAVANAPINPSAMTATDMAGYQAKKREPVCLLYRVWLVCGMGPPSSGGITTLQILGMLQRFDLAELKPGDDGVASADAVFLIAEAAKRAFADRNTYIADPDFLPVPTPGLLDPGYLDERAREIPKIGEPGALPPGMPGISGAGLFAPDGEPKGLSTTHMSIIDGDGNAVSMTTSIETAFGSRLMVRGFLLNNQLTDFAFQPTRGGLPVANAPEGGKRPRSSMAPTLVFDERGQVMLAVGSPGGSSIIGYVAKTLIGVLDWQQNIQAAIAAPNFTNANGPTVLEEGTPVAGLRAALEEKGHEVRVRKRISGLHGIHVLPDGTLTGGADPRREGVALGD